jgi:hypothetical protein
MRYLVLALIVAALFPASAAATDADLGCSYELAPVSPGPVGHENPLRLTIRDCVYEWGNFILAFEGRAGPTRSREFSGFECARDEPGLVCDRREDHTGGTTGTVTPQCFEPFQVTLTVRNRRTGQMGTGDAKQFDCVPPPLEVLPPPSPQDRDDIRKRGVVLRFRCETACTASASVGIRFRGGRSNFGEEWGADKFRRDRPGTYRVRVEIDNFKWRRLVRRGGRKFFTDLTLEAASGEQISGAHEIRVTR